LVLGDYITYSTINNALVIGDYNAYYAANNAFKQNGDILKRTTCDVA
jgi:hypothetical protein